MIGKINLLSGTTLRAERASVYIGMEELCITLLKVMYGSPTRLVKPYLDGMLQHLCELRIICIFCCLACNMRNTGICLDYRTKVVPDCTNFPYMWPSIIYFPLSRGNMGTNFPHFSIYVIYIIFHLTCKSLEKI